MPTTRRGTTTSEFSTPKGDDEKQICYLCSKEVSEKLAEYPCTCFRPCHKRCREKVESEKAEFECPDCPLNITINENENNFTGADVGKLIKDMQKGMLHMMQAQQKRFDDQLKKMSEKANASPSDASDEEKEDLNESKAIEMLTHTLKKMNKSSEQQNERQAKLDIQRIYAELPVVHHIGLEWANFYSMYKKSKEFFEDAQNVLRIQKAINCKKLLHAAGANLFGEHTYHEAIELLNERFNRPYDILRNELKRVLVMRNPQKDDYAALVDFITAVQHYASLQKNLGNINTQSDSAIISQIVEKLPTSYKLRWNCYCAEKEKKLANAVTDDEMNANLITVISLSDFLSKDFDGLNRAASMSMPRSHAHNNFNERRPQANGRSFNNMHSDNPWDYKCCLCVTNNHDIFRCQEAKQLSGKELFSKISEMKICCWCLREGFTGRGHKCSKSPLPQCKKEEHKGQRNNHLWLLCPLRKSSNDPSLPSQMHNNSSHSRGRGGGRGRRGGFKNKRFNSHTQAPSQQEERCENEMRTDDPQTEKSDAQQRTTSASNNHSQPSDENFYFFPSTSKSYTRDYSNHHVTAYLGSVNSDLTGKSMNTAINLLPVVKFSINNTIVAFLLDTGSSISLIEKSIADDLKLYGFPCPVNLKWSGTQTRKDENSRVVKVQVETLHNKNKHTLHLHTFKDLQIASQIFDAQEMRERYPYLKSLHLDSYQKINGVIGQDQAEFLAMSKVITSSKGDSNYIGARSPLGDFVMGNRDSVKDLYDYFAKNSAKRNNSQFNLTTPLQAGSSQAVGVDGNFYLNRATEKELEELEERLMGEDYFSPSVEDRKSANDTLAIQILDEKVFKKNNAYYAPLPFKDENCVMPTQSSFSKAFKRMRLMEYKMLKDNCYDAITEQINNLVKKDYCEILSEEEAAKPCNKAFYIPIFVINPPTKRARLVMDAKDEVEKGKSLNSFLLPGPNLYNKLTHLHSTMREGKYILKGDMMEMFHQIHIIDEHRDCLRFMFSFKPGGKPTFFRMKRLVFGLSSSPMISQYVIRRIAAEYKYSNPLLYDILMRKIYVDDLIISLDDFELAMRLFAETRQALLRGGFNLVKMKANHPDLLSTVLEQASESDLANEKLVSNETKEKLLGYVIDFENDTISLSLALPLMQKIIAKDHPTKKEVLKLTMSIYDPQGLFTFFTSKLKILYHLICKEPVEWNDEIPDHLLSKWRKILQWLGNNELSIPRAYSKKIDEGDLKQLFMFTDAGVDAQCNVAFLRVLSNKNVQKDVSIITAKNYIVPLKQKRTIPELEFDAVAKGIELIKSIIAEHDITFHEIHIVTDSLIVYQWVINGIEDPSIYQRNRLEKIRNSNLEIKFRWVTTDLQTADYGTKFSSMPENSNSNSWFNPMLFRLPEDSWPKIQPSQLKAVNFHVAKNSQPRIQGRGDFIDTSLYSSLNRAIGVARKYILGWIFIHRKKLAEKSLKRIDMELKNNVISSRTHRQEKRMWGCKLEENEKFLNDPTYGRQNILKAFIKEDQGTHWAEELRLIKGNKPLPVKHPLYKHALTLKDDLLCVSTRMPERNTHLSEINSIQAYPILLSSESHLTKLIVLHYHVQNRHLNFDTICSAIVRMYFIPHLRWTAKKIIRNECYFCKLQNTSIRFPQMGDLPEERLCDKHVPFSHVMVDIAGPFMVKQKELRSKDPPKRWLLFVTCLNIRAVHIEILYHMTADSVIKGLTNTFELRGYPLTITSDEGTNFVGSNNEWRKAFSNHNQKRLNEGLEPIQWTFNPAHAHHMNGAVERLIGCAKKAFKNITKMLNEKMAKLDDESFRMLVCSVIGILNNRPLCITPIEGTNDRFLTPNHFLMGRENNFFTPYSPLSSNHPKMWQDVLKLKEILWGHWLKEFIPRCIKREKWITKKNNLEIGDIVLTVEDSKANSWRLGKIVEIIEGSQEQVRKVKVLIGKRNPPSKPTKRIKASKNKELMKKEIMEEYFIGETWIVSRSSAHCVPLNLREHAEETIPTSSSSMH